MSVKYKDILGKLKEIGLSTTQLRRQRLLSESTLSRIRRNGVITTEALDIICNLLHCQPSEIMEIEYDRMSAQERDALVKEREAQIQMRQEEQKK